MRYPVVGGLIILLALAGLWLLFRPRPPVARPFRKRSRAAKKKQAARQGGRSKRKA